MEHFNTKIEGHGEEKFNFICFENTEPIEIGDKFIFFFCGIADIQICDSETVKYEVNKNDRIRDGKTIDMVTDFWKRCYKIKLTNFNLKLIN